MFVGLVAQLGIHSYDQAILGHFKAFFLQFLETFLLYLIFDCLVEFLAIYKVFDHGGIIERPRNVHSQFRLDRICFVSLVKFVNVWND